MLYHYGLKPWEVNELTLYQFRYFTREFGWLQQMMTGEGTPSSGLGYAQDGTPTIHGKKPGDRMSSAELKALVGHITGIKK